MESYIIKVLPYHAIGIDYNNLDPNNSSYHKRATATARLQERMRRGTIQIVKVAHKPYQFSS